MKLTLRCVATSVPKESKKPAEYHFEQAITSTAETRIEGRVKLLTLDSELIGRLKIGSMIEVKVEGEAMT
jgi:hypothetical protein